MAEPRMAPATGASPVKVKIRSDYSVDKPNARMLFNEQIEFVNEASEACTIYFNPSDIFGAENQQIVPGTPLVVGPPAEDDITVVYVLDTPDGETGPFSITVAGCAPVEFDVDSGGNCSIGNAAIPFNGWVEFTYNPSGSNPPSTIDVTFSQPLYDQDGNAISSQALSPGDNPPLVASGVSNVTIRFEFTGTNSQDRIGTGGGTIKVGQ